MHTVTMRGGEGGYIKQAPGTYKETNQQSSRYTKQATVGCTATSTERNRCKQPIHNKQTKHKAERDFLLLSGFMLNLISGMDKNHDLEPHR